MARRVGSHCRGVVMAAAMMYVPGSSRVFEPDSSTHAMKASSITAGHRYRCMSTKRLRAPWKATGRVSVAPLRCLAMMKSASPARGDCLS